MNTTDPHWNRRGFLAAMLSACAAPAIVRAGNLMPIWTPAQQIVLPSTEILIANEVWIEALAGARMSGGSRGDIGRGLCVPYTDSEGVTVMGYRFPKDLR